MTSGNLRLENEVQTQEWTGRVRPAIAPCVTALRRVSVYLRACLTICLLDGSDICASETLLDRSHLLARLPCEELCLLTLRDCDMG